MLLSAFLAFKKVYIGIVAQLMEELKS